MNILLIEDDELIAHFIKDVLCQDSHFVSMSNDGEEGYRKAQSHIYDAIILDVQLPNKDGLSICRDLRRLKVSTPILILSSFGDEETRIAGLDAGADDYLVKPFSYRELKARIRAITRRPSIIMQSLLVVADLNLDPESREVRRSGRLLELRPKEYDLLEYMMRNTDIALPKYLLLSKVWQIRSEAASNRLEVCIRHLREKVDEPYKRKLIKTIHGIGYKLTT